MAYAASMRRYLSDLHREYNSAIRGGQHTAELSYRPVLDRLFRDLAHDLNPTHQIDVVLEPRNQGRVGRPDWRIHDSVSLGIYGYVEAKGLTETPFDTAPYQAQFDRYLTLGHKLVITDGIDFVFCLQRGIPPTIVSIINKANLRRANWASLPIDPQFEMMMRQLYDNPTPQQCDESKLIELVALRTRLLADDIRHYAEIPYDEALTEDERQIIGLLNGIKGLIYNHNDVNLRTDKVFADFVAQVIMFCILYAHRVLCSSNDSPAQKEEKIKAYMYRNLTEEEALLPFRNLMVYLHNNTDAGLFINQWIDECVKFLSFVQMTDYQLMNPDYHQLFEHFLTKFDPRAKFDYGAYYTPKDLADYVVRLTERIAGTVFSGASIYDAGNTIIDPCCGTGSFLEEVIVHDATDGEYNICGFEILPAPYMLANYRMSLVRERLGHRQHSTSIILANSLSNCMFGEPTNEQSIEGKELSRANDWASMPLKLIIGNPPCSDSLRQNTDREFSTILGLMEDFRPPQESRTSRQNTQKQINNPFMQFLRWSCVKLLASPNHSILSMVVPLSFLEGESYQYARKYLQENFSDAWVVSIDADARTGVRNNSLFHTLQGRAVIVLTRKYGEAPGIAEYHFADFTSYGSEEKHQHLTAPTEQLFAEFSTHAMDCAKCQLLPPIPFNEEQYIQFWPVSGQSGQEAIFISHCAGMKLTPTALFTHVKAQALKRRCKEIATGGQATATNWVSGQDRPPDSARINAFQQAMLQAGDSRALDAILQNHIKPFTFRPYLTSNALLWDEALNACSSVGGGGTRSRPEIAQAFSDPATVGFAMAHAPKDIDHTLRQFVSFCWYYPDNDMCSRGCSHIYMNQYAGRGTNGMVSNINARVLTHICGLLTCDDAFAAKAMVFYTYAILCSQVYLDEFAGALYTLSQSDRRARVPIVADRNMFEKVMLLGQQIAELEKADYSPENILGFDYEAVVAQIPRGFLLHKTSHPFDEESEELILNDTHTEIRIHCPIALQHLKISGYEVIKNIWLKFNSYEYTHCEFSSDDARHLLDFLNTLAIHIQTVSRIDQEITPILHNQVELFYPRS